MLARVRRTILERRLFDRGAQVLVACSGGPDSTALTHVLARLSGELGLSLLVACVDHGLRSEAAAEVLAVRRFAEGLGLPFRGLQVQVQPSGSVQAAARRARYAALSELAREARATAIAVGHTLDDQAETVVARLLRGSGVRGLAGIAPRRRDGVVRPLLDCTRDEVEEHLRLHGLQALRDPSNQDRRFERVRIRMDVLPHLEREDPAIARHLAQLADDARAAFGVVRREARRLARVAGEPPRTELLRAAPETLRREVLARWAERVTGRRLGRALLEALDRAVIRGDGEVLAKGGWVLAVGQEGALCAYEDRNRVTRSRS